MIVVRPDEAKYRRDLIRLPHPPWHCRCALPPSIGKEPLQHAVERV